MTVDSVSTGPGLHTVPWQHATLATTPVGGPGAQFPPLTRRLRPPGSFPHMVERPWLLGRVSRAVQDAPLVLLSAPAGYGKTTLAAAWARRFAHRRPVAWLATGERDDQPAIFWSHVVAALSLVGAIAADVATSLLADPTDGYDIEQLGELVLAASLPAVLVLDGAERVGNRAIFDGLGRLLESAGDRLRLLITTRQDPPLPLHRYRLDGTVAEMRYDELAFTETEARTLLALHHVDESDPDVSRLLHRAEGWPAGLRWTALAMPTGAAEARLDDSAAEYLTAEVVDDLSESDRDLLLGVSVVDELPPGLAWALTGRPDADAALQRLSAGNTFVQRLPGRPGHRLHPLARRFLATRLDRTKPDVVADLHGRAADWFAEHNRLPSAIDHATRIGDDARRQLFEAVLAGSDGMAQLRVGDLDAACTRLRAASEAASGVARDLRLDWLAMLALAEACRGHLSAAQNLAGALAHDGETPVAGQLALGWVAVERHEPGRARDALEAAGRQLDDGGDVLLDEVLTLLRVRLMRDRGDSAGARHVLMALEPQLGWLRPQLRAEGAAVGLPTDGWQPDAAEDDAQPGAPTTSQRIWDLLARAQSNSSQGRLPAARSDLARALSLARPERIRRPFVQLAPELRALIRTDPKLLGLAGWLRLVENEPAGPRVLETSAAPIRVELSGRELEVLRQLSALLTTEEIAAELFISINTVRTHIRRILEKLTVSRRNEAVRRGRELGLI